MKNEPVGSLTVDQVAGRAGVSRGLVFHYFPTVRDLHQACLEQAADELMDLIEEAARTTDGEQLRGGLRALVDYISSQPQTFATMAAYAATDPDFGLVFDGIRRRVCELVRTEAGGEIDPLDDLLLAGWVYFVEAAVIRWLEIDSGVERESLIQALEEVIVPVLARSA
ncbi:MAG: TetR/AcrR family transcriptional regulator [Actinomycetia bacterium]|nr:TetR/AcrR family transcriptional regulator [Actinomycetes bacterium]